MLIKGKLEINPENMWADQIISKTKIGKHKRYEQKCDSK